MAKKRKSPPSDPIASTLNTLDLVHCYTAISQHASQQAAFSLVQGELQRARYFKAISERFLAEAATHLEKIKTPPSTSLR